MTRPRAIFVDDEEHLRIAASQSFDLAGIDAACFGEAEVALGQLGRNFDGVVVTDIRMPKMDGVELLAKVKELDPDLPVVMITGHGDVDLAVSCIKNGAYDFIEKPWQPERLTNCVRRAAEQRRLVLENRALKMEALSDATLRDDLHGRSSVMQKLRHGINAIAETDVDVLITGDTGTGKEIAARLLHKQSARRAGPFVHINCAALPEALIESELFGHEAGAFPGAVRARYGKLEHARGGTLCLDEIDLLPMPLQAKLLDILHNRTLTRLGSNDPVALDMRVIALAKTDLDQAVVQGAFRADLLYRLNVATVDMPSLDARREDIPGLFVLLAAQIAKRTDVPLPDVPTDMLNTLSARDWPGNVRELRNAAERFVLGLGNLEDGVPDESKTLADRIATFERSQISAAIAANGGRLKETYESLGLSRKTLYDKMQKHGLSRVDYSDNG
ncbi:MAG: sigma-54 dependent transcriptional regulator [Pseudomonadota bacterium]